MVENLTGDDFQLERVSATRISNVAKVYAWLVVKDSVAITILKVRVVEAFNLEFIFQLTPHRQVLDFVMLKSKTREFLELFFSTMFIISQDPSQSPLANIQSSIGNRDTRTLREVLSKAARTSELVNGLIHFFSKPFRISKRGNDEYRSFVAWAQESSLDILRTVTNGGDMMVD